MTFKVPPHLLSLLILFLSLCLTSLALRRDPETAEVLRCLDECNDEDVQEYIACHKECELRYRQREERREEEERPGSRELDPWWRHRRGRGGGGDGGEWEPEGPRGEQEPARGPQVEYDQCRRLCKPFKQRERERCWEQCEERERARDRQQDGEREHVVDSGVRNPPADPPLSERYERACERQAGGQQGQLSKFRCRQQREREERERPGGGDVNLSLATTTEDPQQQFRHCQQRCEQQHRREPQRRQCRQECERQFREQRRGKRISTNPREQEEEEEEMGEWGDNPYYFHSRTLRSRFRSEEGRIRVLERFDRRSDLLRGLKNYRLKIFEANPSTFVLPHHIDADCILVVLKG